MWIVLLVAVVFVSVVWIFRLGVAAARQKTLIKAQAELQSRLLDKLGGSDDLVRYLESGAGRQLLEAPPVERTRPHARVLAALQAGIILTVAGAAFLFLGGRFPEDAEGFTVLGTLGLALGVGFLASGALAHFLSRSWGLIDGRERSES
jgi:hypothetical protein